MHQILLGDCLLGVKDYHCESEGSSNGYIPKDRCSLWLYVDVTEKCNAACPFCVAGAGKNAENWVVPEQFFEVLKQISPILSGISFTGGEPTLDMDLLGQLISGTVERVPDTLEIDLVTNGSHLSDLSTASWVESLTTLHISRHAQDDALNCKLMGFPAPSKVELCSFLSALRDPGQVVFNCVMQKGGVENMEDVAAYLDAAAEMGVQNSSFISMFHANTYCKEHYISSRNFPVMDDEILERWNLNNPESTFRVWNRQRDHGYCRCCSGDYRSSHGSTRFYFRCPGTIDGPAYCRQLVYTADNVLQDGFGKDRKTLIISKRKG